MSVLSKNKNTLLQGVINHVTFVLDKSSSMSNITRQVIQVTDNQIQHLSQISQSHDQETRVSIYCFSDYVEPIVYDKDVMRLPSIKDYYKPDGMTALVDATLKAIEDLEKTSTLYGEHSFLIFVLTDGAENASQFSNHAKLKAKLSSLPPEWTIAILVPNQMGRSQALKYGFQPDNIQIWDPSAKGIEEVSAKLQTATSNYMTMRGSNKDFKGTSNIFDLNPQNVKKALKTGDLKALPKSQYSLFPVSAYDLKARNSKGEKVAEISTFVTEHSGRPYEPYTSFYELVKTEPVQPQKRVAIMDKKTKEVFLGDAARQMLGLSTQDTQRLKPAHNDSYIIFIESASTNRHLFAGSTLLYIPN